MIDGDAVSDLLMVESPIPQLAESNNDSHDLAEFIVSVAVGCRRYSPSCIGEIHQPAPSRFTRDGVGSSSRP